MARTEERHLASAQGTGHGGDGGRQREVRQENDGGVWLSPDAVEDVVEMESQESFPASDAPGWTMARVGKPAHAPESVTSEQKGE